MAGYSKLDLIGASHGLDESIPRGLREVGGPNPIEMLILVGDGSRQWLEPHYVDPSIKPIGRIRAILPAGPDDPNSLLDACIASAPATSNPVLPTAVCVDLVRSSSLFCGPATKPTFMTLPLPKS